MWEIDNNFQLISFLVSCGFGVIYCLFYDIFRALRKVNSISDGAVFLQDVVYFLIISVVTFMLLIALANGEVRGYVIIGLLAGFVFCFCTFSKIHLKILIFVFSKISLVSGKTVNLINAVFDTICLFLSKTVKKIGELLNNMKKLFKNLLKKIG